ncbi:zinc ribbon domain-containing protein [Methylocaldum sp. MU1018]
MLRLWHGFGRRKSGRYQYYKCATKLSKAIHLCPTPNRPRAKIDRLVLERLANRVFTVPRVTAMPKDLSRRLKERWTADDQRLHEVQQALATVEAGRQRLYEAVEQGILPLDQTLSVRVEALKRQREMLLSEMAGLRRRRRTSLDRLTPAKIAAFIQVLRERRLDPNSGFGKCYRQILASEVRVTCTTIELKGELETLAEAQVCTMGGGDPECLRKQVPRFISIWRPQGDSNPCYRRERVITRFMAVQ